MRPHGESKWLAIVASLAITTLATPVLAQPAPAAGQTASQGVSLTDIVVTAERREQNVQAVPANVNVVPQIELQRENINQLSDYLTSVPGIDWNFANGPVGGRGRQNVGIRGVERTNGLEASAIGFYIDDTSIEVANPRIFDLNRIEVLSGPQGTLYGASSMGGTIKLITNQPQLGHDSFETDGGVDNVAHGGTGWDVNQMINVAMGDKVALRMAGTLRDDPGYIDNYSQSGALLAKDINGSQAREIRASLLIAPNDRLQITPSVFYHNFTQDAAPSECRGCGLPAYGVQQYNTTESQEEFTLVGLNIKYDLGWADLTSQTSYYDYHAKTNEDLTLAFATLDGYYPAGIQSTGNQTVYSEEDRISSKLKGPVQFVAGVYFADSERPFTSQSLTPGLNAALAAHGSALVLPTTPQGDNYFIAILTSHQVQYAGFAEGTWSVTHSFDLTLGGRYFDFKDNSTDTFSGYTFRALAPVPPGSASEQGFNPKVNATWRPTSDLLFYATVDRGFRPGNGNIALPTNCNTSLINAGITPPGPSSFKSDSLWNYEVGAKTGWFDNKLTADLTGYRMDWTNIEVTVPLPSCAVQGFVVNAGNAVSEGAEFQLAARPVPPLELTFSGAYDNAYLTSASKILAAPAGYPLTDTPKWSLSASGQYSFPIGSALQGYLHADARYRGVTYLDFTGKNLSQPLTEIGMRVGVLGQNRMGRWEAALYVENLTDANPYLGLITDRYAFAGMEYNSVTPRTVGVDLTFHY